MNPDFTKSFVVAFRFEEVQPFVLRAYDRDGPSEDLSAHDFLGEVLFKLGNLMGARGQTLVVDAAKCEVVMRGTELVACG